MLNSTVNSRLQSNFFVSVSKITSSKSKIIFVLVLVLVCQFKTSKACDIVGASACPHKPDNDLKEENFEDYCLKYKLNLECVYKKYKGCDKKEKYVEAMESMIKGLRKKAKQLAKQCDIEIDIPDDQPKKVVNIQDVRSNGQPTKKSTTPPPPCKINTISLDCHPIMTNVQFNPSWNGVMKSKWCNSAGPYHNCIKARLLDCYGPLYVESVAYYEKIQKYIHSQSNINCPGGLEGCTVNANDVRCKMGVKYGETSSADKVLKRDKFYFLFYLVSFLIYNFF